jgi:hypothetical protein
MTTGKIIQQAIESFIRTNAALSKRIGEPITHVTVGPDIYPSNRGYVYPCCVNNEHEIVIKYAPNYIESLHNEVTAYRVVQSIENVPALLASGDGIIALKKVKDASQLRVDAFDASTADQVLNFLGSLRLIERQESPDSAKDSIVQAARELREDFKSFGALDEYFTDVAVAMASYDSLVTAASESVAFVHRVHGDFSFSNIIQSNDELFFVDWEMSRISDGATDSARLLRDIIQDVNVFEKEERLSKLQKFLPIANYFIDTSAHDSNDTKVWPRIYFWLVTRTLNGGNHFESVRLQLEGLLSESSALNQDTAQEYFRTNTLRISVVLKGIGAICPVDELMPTIEKFQTGELDEFAAMIQRYQWGLDLRCQYATRLALGAAACAEVLLREAPSARTRLPEAEKFI